MHLLPGTEFVISVTATCLTLTPKTRYPKVTVQEVRGYLAKRGRALRDDSEIKVSIKGKLKAQDDASKG
ncbi:hypothetical protein AAKU67_000504 [Oxalobacteraceae bacterium GrIS 2.11]